MGTHTARFDYKLYMRRLYFIVLILLLGIADGCGGGKALKGIDQGTSGFPPLQSRNMIDRQAYSFYANGTIFEAMGEIAMANRQYAEALRFYPDSPEIRYAYAGTFFRLGDYRRVLKELESVRRRGVGHWLLLADSYRALGVNDSARAAYREAVTIDSNNVGAYHYLAAFYQQANQLDSAVWAYGNISRLSASFRVFQEIGNLQMRLNRLDEAKESYFQSIALDSSENNVRSYLGLSVIYEQSGNRVEAKRYLEMAGRLSPQNAMIQNRLLGYYEEDNELDKAIIVARNVIPLAPQDRNLVRRLGIIYYDADSLRLADSIFTLLLNQGDENILNYYYGGRTAFLKGDYDRARTDFRKVTAMADSVVDGWLNLGLVYQVQDSTDPEILSYRDGLQFMKNPDASVRLLFVMAAALEKRGSIDSSVTVFESILKIRPEHSQSLNYLAYMLAERGVRLDYATELVQNALAIIPDNGAYIDSYGWILYKKGNFRGALEQMLRAYNYISNDATILEHLGDVYQALADSANARIFWKRALEIDPGNRAIKEKLEQ